MSAVVSSVNLVCHTERLPLLRARQAWHRALHGSIAAVETCSWQTFRYTGLEKLRSFELAGYGKREPATAECQENRTTGWQTAIMRPQLRWKETGTHHAMESWEGKVTQWTKMWLLGTGVNFPKVDWVPFLLSLSLPSLSFPSIPLPSPKMKPWGLWANFTYVKLKNSGWWQRFFVAVWWEKWLNEAILVSNRPIL